MSENEIKQAWVILDGDQDGNISYEEFQQTIEQYENPQTLIRTQMSPSQKTDLVFKLYDENNDHYLALNEVRKLIADSISDSTVQDAKWLIASLDLNGDGKLAWFEVYAALK